MLNIKFYILLGFLYLPFYFNAQSYLQGGSSPTISNLVHHSDLSINSDVSHADLYIIDDQFVSGNQNQPQGVTNSLLQVDKRGPTHDGVISNQTIFKISYDKKIGILTKNPSKDFHINGETLLDGDSYFNDSATFNDIITAHQKATFNNQITVSGLATFNDYARFGDNVQINGNLTLRNPSGLGNGSTQIKLSSQGDIRAREIKVDLETIPDYVFKDDYDLMPIQNLKDFINKFQHLPNILSEDEFNQLGHYPLGEMNRKLLEKIEELTLYVIELQEQINELKK